MTRFGLLGPLLIEEDGVRVGVEAPKPRIVLAALLLHANQIVTVERLIEALWDETPPASARVTVQGHVKRLRQALGAGIAARISTTTTGYVMRVDREELDCAAFGVLHDRARCLASTGDLDGASRALAEAQNLWRGEPLLDVPSAVLRREHADALVERRNRLLELHAEVQLSLGNFADLVPGLRGLIAKYPLRERLYAHLMTALHRCGRTAEALEVFRSARRELVEQAGVEPGPELQSLHRTILSATSGPSHAPVVVERPVCQLPPDIPDFTGRHLEAERLHTELSNVDTSAAALVCGAAGVGKTALAVHVAHRLRGIYRDGQLFVTLHGSWHRPMATSEALAWLLRALGVSGAALPADLDERSACLRAAVADRRLLILLDDAGSAAQVRALLPGTVGSAVLITSRSRLVGLEAATRLPISPLRFPEAHSLFASVAGPSRVDPDPSSARDVVRLCGRLPLALRVAASRLATHPEWTVGDLASRLAGRHRLDELVAGDLSVRNTFDMAYRALDPWQAKMFRLLAASGIDNLPLMAVAALSGLPSRSAETVADSLVDLHLLTSQQPGCYRYHDLLRLYAQEVLSSDEQQCARAEAMDRLHRAYRESVLAACALTRPEGSQRAPTVFLSVEQARAWLDREYPAIVAVIAEACERGQEGLPIAVDILSSVGGFLRATGRWDEWQHAASAVLCAATDLVDLHADLVARQQLGMIHVLRGQIDEGEKALARSLDIARRTGARGTEAYVLNRLGLLEFNRSRVAQGLEYELAAYDIFTALGDDRGRVTVLANVAMMRSTLDDPAGALEAVKLGLRLAKRLGDQQLSVMLLHHRGNAKAGLGQLHEATRDFRRCLALTRRHGLREGEAFTLGELGRIHLDAGRVGEAVRYLQAAIGKFRHLEAPLAAGSYLTFLGRAWLAYGRPADAAAAWREARRLLDPGDPPGVATLDTLLASLKVTGV